MFGLQSVAFCCEKWMGPVAPGWEEKQNSHCNLTTSAWASTSFHPHKHTNPSLHPSLSLSSSIFFLIHPPFFCCWRAYASTRAPFLLLLNPGTNETSGFVNHSEQASVTPTFSEHFCRSDTGGRLTFRERIGYASWSSVANIIIIIISALTELLSGLHCGR